MLFTIVTLHEFVHYGRDVNKLTKRVSINGTLYESGLIFELSISPINNYNYIDRNNAIEWVKFYKTSCKRTTVFKNKFEYPTRRN